MGTQPGPDPVESGRRARAAVAYSGISKPDAARAAGLSVATLGRLYAGTRQDTTWEDLWRLADACELPREWFSADFCRLHEIVTEGPTFRRSTDALERIEQETAEALQRARQQRDKDAAAARARRRGGRSR